MNRSIALAYGITGLAVAAALVIVVGSTTGLFGAGSPAPMSFSAGTPNGYAANAATVDVPADLAPASPASPTASQLPEPEVVYVDAPPATRAGDDDDDDDDDDRGARRSESHHRSEDDDD